MALRKLFLILLLFAGFISNAQTPQHWLLVGKRAGFIGDEFPGSSLNYSFRKGSSSYSGNCIQVRRSNDDSLFEIGFVGNFLDTATMKTVIGSNSAYIRIWYDQSGVAPNAAQGVNGRQPRIMLSGVIDRVQNIVGEWMVAALFDGSDDNLSLGVGISSIGDYSVFLVSKRTSNSVKGMIIGSGNGTGAVIAQWSDGNDYFQNLSAPTAATYSFISDATATFCLLNSFSISNTITAYRDGSSLSLSSGGGFVCTTAVWNGVGVYNSSSFSSAYACEIIIYTSDKSADRVGIQTNINNFYKLY